MVNKKYITFSIIAVISVLLITATTILSVVCAKLLKRKDVFVVLVSDELYTSRFADFFKESSEEPFIFASLSAGLPESETFGDQYHVAALLSMKEEIPAILGSEQKESALHIYFPVHNEDVLPSVPADFANESSPENNLLSPDLSMSFCRSKDLPETSRALPVDGIYAGDENYPLKITEYVEAVVFCKDMEEAVSLWCKNHFSPENAGDAVSLETEKPVFIASVGDIMVARGAEEVLISETDGLKEIFGDTLPLLQNADFTIGNLEGVVTDSWKNATKTYTFKFKKDVLPKLLDAGFDYLMQTNNHCYDYGESGFKDTLAAFSEYKIPSSGIGYNADEARKFFHTTVNGLKLAIISCGAFPVERSGFNGKTTATATETRAGILWEDEQLLEDIKREKNAGAFVIVNVHGGNEYVFKPSEKQRALYESFCDAGADIVFGSHPHVLQPTEWHGNSLIVYSMGNFVFNGMEEMNGATDSEVVRVGVLDGRIAYVEQYPAKLDGHTVDLVK